MTTSRDPLDALTGADPLAAVLDATAALDLDAGPALDAVLDPSLRRPPAPVTPEPRQSTGTFRGDTERELSDLERGIKDRKKAERDRFRAATDTEYWFAVCFRSRAEKDAFLVAAGLDAHGDKYLDGRVVAAALDVPMDAVLAAQAEQ